MTARFFDLSNDENPLNDTVLLSLADIMSVIERLRHELPCMFQLQLEDGCRLEVGIAHSMGCVQHTRRDGMPPYRMATTSSSPILGRDDIEFAVGGTATPIDSRYCIPLDMVELLLGHLLEGTELPAELTWEDV